MSIIHRENKISGPKIGVVKSVIEIEYVKTENPYKNPYESRHFRLTLCWSSEETYNRYRRTLDAVVLTQQNGLWNTGSFDFINDKTGKYLFFCFNR